MIGKNFSLKSCIRNFVIGFTFSSCGTVLADTPLQVREKTYYACMFENYKSLFSELSSPKKRISFEEYIYFSALGQIYRRADFTDAANLFDKNPLKEAYEKCRPKNSEIENLLKEDKPDLLKLFVAGHISMPMRFVLWEKEAEQFIDNKKAFEFFFRSAELGDVDSFIELAEMYWHGVATPKNHSKAIQNLIVAAKKESVLAQRILGLRYAGYPGGLMYIGDEQGFEPNFFLAYVWLNIASAGGDTDASKWRGEVVEKLTPKQVEEAQSLSEQCFSSKFKECLG